MTRRAPGQEREVRDQWLDLIHGGECAGCARPGRLLCPECEAALPVTAYPTSPDPPPVGLAPAWVTTDYTGTVRALVLGHKERRGFALAAPLGQLLALAVGEAIRGEGPGAAPAPSGPWLLVPVPTRGAAVRARGHDSTLRMVRAAAGLLRRTGHDVVACPLLRHRLPVADQAGLDRAQRTANRADSLVLDPRRYAALRRTAASVPAVVLCDDVLTTGATAREAQRALADAGLPVRAIACVAATRRRRSTTSLPFSPPTY